MYKIFTQMISQLTINKLSTGDSIDLPKNYTFSMGRSGYQGKGKMRLPDVRPAPPEVRLRSGFGLSTDSRFSKKFDMTEIFFKVPL